MIPSTIWTNALLTVPAQELLVEGTRSHRLIIGQQPTDVLAVGAADPSLDKAEIVFGQPPSDFIRRTKVLQWLHLSSAGYTRYDTKKFRETFQTLGAKASNSSGVFDEPCAEHLMAWLLADARQIYPAYDNQRDACGWPQNQLRANVRLLADQTILILGYGAIGRRLTELLAPYPVRIIGYRRTPQPDAPISVVGPDDLPGALKSADHVINILPESNETNGFFNPARFSLVKAGSRYYSIGRGPTTDQEALRNALETGNLAAAYLDVTDPEPLPPHHPLWNTKNCFITPHMSGGHFNESIRNVQHFLDNLTRFENNSPLVNQII
jgi:phosphoglycerate dehydrogenase-like enzyme